MTTTSTTNAAAIENALLDVNGDKPIRRLDRELGNTPKLRLDANDLTPRDMKRARIALGGDPYKLLAEDDVEDRIAFIMWCLLSRTDPTLTFDQALDTRLGQFDMGDPPPTPAPAANGASPKKRTARASGTKPTAATPAPSGGPTST